MNKAQRKPRSLLPQQALCSVHFKNKELPMMSQTDKELLELAAKAYGVTLEYRRNSDAYYYDDPETGREEWFPLGKDGQALRLAVKLEIEVRNFNGKSHAGKQGKFWRTQAWFPDGDPYAATRRAIVRAAAEIGQTLPA